MPLAGLLPDVNQQYATAEAAHYTSNDLHQAIELYNEIIAAYPGSAEAARSRKQLLNIANTALALTLLDDV